jgi:hypothetical protein
MSAKFTSASAWPQTAASELVYRGPRTPHPGGRERKTVRRDFCSVNATGIRSKAPPWSMRFTLAMQRGRAAVGELRAFFRRRRAPGPRNCYSISESCSLRAGCFKRLPGRCVAYTLTCMSMVRTTVYLDQEIALALRQLAARQGRRQAELIRDALASYVRTKGPAAFGARPTLRRIYVFGSICESDRKTCENSTASSKRADTLQGSIARS